MGWDPYGWLGSQLVTRLLDVVATPRKPQYGMASEVPLCLYDCGFEELQWHTDPAAHSRTLDALFAQWEDKALRASVLAGMRHSLLHASIPRPPFLAPAACPDRLAWVRASWRCPGYLWLGLAFSLAHNYPAPHFVWLLVVRNAAIGARGCAAARPAPAPAHAGARLKRCVWLSGCWPFFGLLST